MSTVHVDWMQFAGTEIVNAARTLTYIRKGELNTTSAAVNLRAPLLAESGCGYTDVYEEDYEGPCVGGPQNLACYCDAVSDVDYLSPEADPAPWWTAGDADSAEFLGVLTSSIRLQSVSERTVIESGTIGGSVGRRRTRTRVVQVQGFLVGATDAGLSWGQDWLTEQLRGTDAGCAPDTLRILRTCPESLTDGATAGVGGSSTTDSGVTGSGFGSEIDGGDAFSFSSSADVRELIGTGLVDGPAFGPVQRLAGCLLVTVEWQMVAGDPHLRTIEEVLLTEQSLTLTGDVSASLVGPPGTGDAAAIISVQAGDSGTTVSDLTISYGGFSFDVDALPLRATLVIDGSRRTVRWSRTAGGPIDGFADSGGLDALTFTGVFQFPTTAHDTTLTIDVDTAGATINPGTTVAVASVQRVL